MKIINLQGMTTAERLKYLEEITQEIYNHLYDDYIWVYAGAYVSNSSTYSATRLNGYQDNLDLKSKQIVYFAESGVVALIDKINDVANTFTVNDNYSIKGDKGDKGEQGEPGEKGETGEPGATGLAALQTSQIVDINTLPAVNATFNLNESLCNRTPVAGDIFTCVIQGTENILGRSWLATCVVLYEGRFKGQFKGFVETTGESPQKLYEHYFYFECGTSTNNSFFSYGMYWIDANGGHASPAPTTIEEVIAYLETINNKMWYGFGFAETNDGKTVDETGTCMVVNLRKRSDGSVIAELRKIPGNNLYSVVLKDFVNSVGTYTISFKYNTALGIGASANGLNAMVLYSDKNGVLLDTPESLEHDFAALKAAGSNESKILESINEVRSMNS